ncbi:glycosyltransferase [Asticcacaulis endophyticus]|uniref:Glycosyl transferase n=1 Tax=Asticcacaulis endophyticus TaxID=1395890 RepID=A0A918PWY3_9CAUL|nr:glycosyltransferase [Asticcacaulis endophyticus]GGZ25981.1 glycosyl transferase [Asticcacaulis endophyticus]
MKVALVHYWLVGMRGGERVLEALCELYPDADIFTLVADPAKLSPTILKHKIHTSFLQKFGGVKHYKAMLPLMPFAIESFDVTGYDLVISSEAGPAKAIVTRPDATHICYCHSPMRYIWDLYDQYRSSMGFMGRLIMSIAAPMLRVWDVTTASRVDHFIANSHYVAKRIEKFYRRDATVINPPVDTSRFVPLASNSDGPGDYYLCAGQITPYKKVSLAVETFTKSGKPLVVIGAGADSKLKASAGPNVQFLDSVDDKAMAHHFAHCRALVFPGVEDFGIIPLEVMASGRPVIAYAKGGALETVVDGKTGILFKEQTVESLMAAVEEMETRHESFDPATLSAHASSFAKPIFVERLRRHIEDCLKGEDVPPSPVIELKPSNVMLEKQAMRG